MSVCYLVPDASLFSSSNLTYPFYFLVSYFGTYWFDTNNILSIIFSNYSILGNKVVSSSSSFIKSTPIYYYI